MGGGGEELRAGGGVGWGGGEIKREREKGWCFFIRPLTQRFPECRLHCRCRWRERVQFTPLVGLGRNENSMYGAARWSCLLELLVVGWTLTILE